MPLSTTDAVAAVSGLGDVAASVVVPVVLDDATTTASAPTTSVVEGAQIVRVGALGPIVRRGAWLLAETILIPMVLLCTAMRLSGPTAGLITVLVWRVGLTFGRAAFGHRIPAAVVLSTTIFCTRAFVSLAFASVYIYLWQPVIMSALLGLVFIGSALVRQPITMKLAHDLVTLPDVLENDPRVQRIFGEIAVVLGVVQLVCAGIGASTLHGPVETIVIIHGCLGVVCALGMVGGGIGWGWWRMRSLPDIKIGLGATTD